MTARADRIGHGVDIMHENSPDELLKEMARRGVLVEICLSSNDLILGVSGAEHRSHLHQARRARGTGN